MGDERRDRQALELAGHRRRERQDVVHDDVGSERGRAPGGSAASPARPPRTASAAARGSERPDIRARRRTRMPSASTCRRHRSQVSNITCVAARSQPRPSASIGNACPGSPNAPRKKRRRSRAAVRGARVAGGGRQAASSAIARSCAIRSSAVKAIGVTISVPTPRPAAGPAAPYRDPSSRCVRRASCARFLSREGDRLRAPTTADKVAGSPREAMNPMRNRRRASINDLRVAIDCLPRETRIAMLEGVRTNEMIVGAYADR